MLDIDLNFYLSTEIANIHQYIENADLSVKIEVTKLIVVLTDRWSSKKTERKERREIVN